MMIWNYQDFEYIKRLFKAITKNWPNLECLYINIQFEDLNGIKEILLSCTILNKLHLYIDDDIEEEEDNCDEILNILADCSPKTFNEFFFNENSITGLQNFFERWRGRTPIKFYTNFNRSYHFTTEHIEVLKKYYGLAVIDSETRLWRIIGNCLI